MLVTGQGDETACDLQSLWFLRAALHNIGVRTAGYLQLIVVYVPVQSKLSYVLTTQLTQ